MYSNISSKIRIVKQKEWELRKFLVEIANGKISESTDLPRVCVCYLRQSRA